MSSSRSIAAARQRRAGDIVQKQPIGIRQQQQQMMAQRPNPNQRMTNPAATYNAQMQQQQMQQMMQPQQQYGVAAGVGAEASMRKPKIEVGTAIGLITLRLGRLETFIQQISENGEFKKDLIGSATNLPDNSKIVDNSVFSSLLARMDNIENRMSKNISQEGDLKTMKDMVLNLNATLEKQMREVNEKILDIEAAIGEIESRIQFNPEDDGMIASADYYTEQEAEVEGVSFEIAEDQ